MPDIGIILGEDLPIHVCISIGEILADELKASFDYSDVSARDWPAILVAVKRDNKVTSLHLLHGQPLLSDVSLDRIVNKQTTDPTEIIFD